MEVSIFTIFLLGLLKIASSGVELDPNPPTFQNVQQILTEQITFHYPCILFSLSIRNKSDFSLEKVLPITQNPNLIYQFHPEEVQNVTKFISREALKSVETCILAALDLPQNFPSILGSLAKILFPRLSPIILRDRDKVIAITEDKEDLKTFLKSPEFGVKLKFKIGITRKSPGIYTACEFCKEKEEMLELQQNDLWKDYENNFDLATMRVCGPISTQTRFNWTIVNGKKIPSNGVLVPVLKFIQEAFNFTIEIIPASRGGGTGIGLSNGTWTGAIGDIKDGRADIAMCTAETYARTKVVGFTPVVNFEPITFISGPPKKIYSITAVLWPLGNDVWIGVIILATVAVIILHLSFKARVGHPDKHWPLGKIVEYIAGSLIEEGPALPKNIPVTARIFLTVWLFCSMVVTTAYLSKLVGFLTFPLVDEVPQTGDELVKSKFKWGLTYMGGAAYYIIKSSQTKTFQGIFAKMELIKSTNHFSCLERTLTSRFICIGYKIIPDFYLNNDLKIKPGQSPVIVSEDYFISVPVGISMQDKAPFGPKMRKVVYRFTAAGLVPEWERQDFRMIREKNREKMKNALEKGKYTAPKGLSDVTHGSGGGKEDGLLTLKHLKGAFVILFMGSITSLVGFLYERFKYLWRKLWKNKRAKTAWGNRFFGRI